MATTLKTLRRLLRNRLQEAYALITPGSPNVSTQGTPGVKTVTYKITAYNALGETVASQGKTITTSAATLNGTNYNQLTWTAVDNATGYKIYRTASDLVSPATLGLIGTTTGTFFNDTGLAGDSATAPTENTTGLTNPFWSEDELLGYLVDGCKDLWRAIVDLHQGHFTTIDEDNVSLASGDRELTGVPADCHRVLSIEPRDLTSSSSSRNLRFWPKPYKSKQFMFDRSQDTLDPSSQSDIYYDVLNAGSPVAAPTIVVSRPLSSTVLLRFVYTHTLATLTESDNVPIPGEADNALLAWGMAYARSKEHEQHVVDPSWMETYEKVEKPKLLTALTPRQEQEEEVVEDLFAWGC